MSDITHAEKLERLSNIEIVQEKKIPNDVVSFLRKKDFLFLAYLGNGGLGETILLLDQEMNMRFVCKKYQPYSNQIQEKYYQYFKNEIKLMLHLYHPILYEYLIIICTLNKQQVIF